jgi:hypothetical protein
MILKVIRESLLYTARPDVLRKPFRDRAPRGRAISRDDFPRISRILRPPARRG